MKMKKRTLIIFLFLSLSSFFFYQFYRQIKEDQASQRTIRKIRKKLDRNQFQKIFLEKKGIDTSKMTNEYIAHKYNSLRREERNKKMKPIIHYLNNRGIKTRHLKDGKIKQTYYKLMEKLKYTNAQRTLITRFIDPTNMSKEEAQKKFDEIQTLEMTNRRREELKKSGKDVSVLKTRAEVDRAFRKYMATEKLSSGYVPCPKTISITACKPFEKKKCNVKEINFKSSGFFRKRPICLYDFENPPELTYENKFFNKKSCKFDNEKNTIFCKFLNSTKKIDLGCNPKRNLHIEESLRVKLSTESFWYFSSVGFQVLKIKSKEYSNIPTKKCVFTVSKSKLDSLHQPFALSSFARGSYQDCIQKEKGFDCQPKKRFTRND
ncbi:MAG: hypothetical protein KC493_12675 [Bacteriovoracaceae bacterium]|nr:hypothetical protein [Bacteriovoracaceae bacterium]